MRQGILETLKMTVKLEWGVDDAYYQTEKVFSEGECMVSVKSDLCNHDDQYLLV